MNHSKSLEPMCNDEATPKYFSLWMARKERGGQSTQTETNEGSKDKSRGQNEGDIDKRLVDKNRE